MAFIMKIKLAALIMAMLLIFTTSCSSNTPAGNTTGYTANKIRLAYTFGSVGFIACLMQEMQLLEKHLPEGIAVEWNHIDSGSEIRDAIIAGQLDITYSNYTTFLITKDKGLPITLVSNGYPVMADLISNDIKFQSIGDFSSTDKILIPSLGSTYEFSMRLLCKEAFADAGYLTNSFTMSPDDTMITQLITSNYFHGAVVKFPLSSAALKTNGLHLVTSLTPTMIDNGLGGCNVANDEYIKNNPAILDAFLNAQKEAVDHINQNTADAAARIGRFIDVDPTVVEDVLKQFPATLEVSEQAYNTVGSFLLENGLVESPPKPFSSLPNYDSIPKVA